MRVVCVDDEKLVLDLTVSMVKSLPFVEDVQSFTDAREALAYFDENEADVALLDIDMPEMNGIAMAVELKSRCPDVSIVFLTGYSEYAVEAFAMHASGYLLKPVGKDRLTEELEHAMEVKPVDIKDEPEEEKKIEEPKPELEEKIEEPKPELEEKIEEPKPEIEKKEEEPKLEEKIEEPKKDKVDMKALSENEMFKAAQKVEDDYRKTLDPKDDFGREKLIGSAEKTLYLATVLHGCGVQAKTQEDAESLLEKGMRDFGKANSVSFRRYKFEFLTDKDFNKEFQERVIKGAEEGKISHDDILTYRDEALKACFTKYKGKDTKALNNLSNKIGSKVNSDNAKVEAKPKVHVMQ